MKQLLLVAFAQVVLTGCATTKEVVPDVAVFRSYQQPFKIFGVGDWNNRYSIVTLVDDKSNYFTIKALKSDSNRIGSTYYIK